MHNYHINVLLLQNIFTNNSLTKNYFVSVIFHVQPYADSVPFLPVPFLCHCKNLRKKVDFKIHPVMELKAQ